MKSTFIPIDYDYFDWKGRNYVSIFGRDNSGKRVCIIDDCDVYLWAVLDSRVSEKQIEKLINKILKIQLDLKGRKTKVEKVEVKEKNFSGKAVKALKIFATNYKDLHEIANHLDFKEIEKRRGYDLGYITHYIIEKQLTPLNFYEVEGDILNNSEEFGGIDMALDVDMCIKVNSFKQIKNLNFKPKTLAFDIETDELEIGKGEILMVSLVSENFKKVLTWKKSSQKQDYVEYVEDECELLEKFVEYVKYVSPDFLVGYFSDGFDMPYLKSRASKFNLKLPLGLDGSQPIFSRGANLSAKIKGITHVDLLRFIKTAYAQYMKSETLSLNEVAKEFLGDKKKEFEFKHSSNIKENEWEKYFEYNLHDSVLTYQLFEKFWPDILEFSRTIQEPSYDLSRAGLSKYTESYILHNLNKFNEIPEKRPGRNEILERRNIGGVKGAFVMDTKPGLYEDIAIFDFTSMHTSIIISHNISKDTLLEKKEKNAYESPEIETKEGVKKYYFSRKLGFFPELLKEIFELRKKFKLEYKKNPNPITKARSNAFKVLSASAHGYVGFFGARYYSHEASAAILAFVREFNKQTISKVQKNGHEVIFGDTDSVGLLRNKKSKKEIKELLEKLNSELPGVMRLELEGFFKRGLWVTTRSGLTGAKKKYALIDEKGEIKIRGFETVRRDWCQLSRKTQNKIIKLILEDGNEKRALEYLKKVIKKIKNREVDLKELIIKTQLKKPLSEYKAEGPHVIAARRMKEQEIPVSQGNLIEYYIADGEGKKKKLVRDRVKLPHEKGQYEIQYYLEKQILPAVENIFQVFGINLKEIIDGKKQTTLGDF
jgi:DNA polymerase elongation subunit (family B)